MDFDLRKDITYTSVFRMSLPMMISALSSHFMMILDQLILSRYSIDAMTGASSASVWCSALQCSLFSITMVAGAFVGNYNGAKQYKKASIPVWQMFWFSLFVFALSIPLALFSADICVPENLATEGIPYFRLMMSWSPLTGAIYSLTSFFISINRGSIVTISIFASNVVNLVLDVILVFGLFGFDSYTGSTGAAIGTIAAWFVNFLILFYYFLKKPIREKYDTLNFKINVVKMKECLKLGVAGGIGHIFEMSAWGMIYYLLAKTGREVAMMQSIAVSVNIFMAFIVSGLEKGMMAITANLLGIGLKEKTKTLMKKGFLIHYSFLSISAMILFLCPQIITDNFIHFDVSPEIVERTHFVLRMVLVYFLFDGMVWIIAGVIEGGGDINYTMIAIATSLWTIVTLPSIILSNLGMLQIEYVWGLLIVAIVLIDLILYHRYRSDKWVHIRV